MTRFLISTLVVSFAWSGIRADDPKSGATVFGLDKVHKLELALSAADWAAMQPKEPDRPFGGPPGGGPPGGRGGPPGPMPNEYPYVKGRFAYDGESLADVGVRFKGNSSYRFAGDGIKRPFHLDFNRYVEGAQFHGLKSLCLSNNAMDESHVREAVAYEVYRAAGVPAARTAFVELTLDVPGLFDRKLAGLYTAVEPVDKTFLKEHFDSGKGMLLKPERVHGIEYFGDDWKAYERYTPKDDPSKKEKARFIAFAKLVNRADDATFRKEIGDYLDVPGFLKFVAATAYLANMDSFLGPGHNVYIFLNPTTNRFHFLPWDLNQAFGTMFPFGAIDRQANLSILHPHAGRNVLIDRLLADSEVKAAYLAEWKKLASTAFATDKVLKLVADCSAVVKEAMVRDAAANRGGRRPMGPPPGPGGGRGMTLTEFVTARGKSVADQLAGKSTGYVPENSRPGPPGRGRGGE